MIISVPIAKLYSIIFIFLLLLKRKANAIQISTHPLARDTHVPNAWRGTSVILTCNKNTRLIKGWILIRFGHLLEVSLLLVRLIFLSADRKRPDAAGSPDACHPIMMHHRSTAHAAAYVPSPSRYTHLTSLPPSFLLQLSFCNLSPSLLLLHIPIANMLLFCLFSNHPSLLLLDRVGPSGKLQTTQKIAFFLFVSSWRGFHRQIWYFFGCRWLR